MVIKRVASILPLQKSVLRGDDPKYRGLFGASIILLVDALASALYLDDFAIWQCELHIVIIPYLA